MNSEVAHAKTAEQLMARAGKTFHRAAWLLPRSVRGEVVALYAFCRRVDDIADTPGIAALQRRRQLDQIVAAFDSRNRSALRAAGWPFAAVGSRADAARLLVRAAAGDLHPRQPADEQELMAYAFGVAGTVGLMMADVLGAQAEGAHAAVALGIAMQLSNIARDVTEDFQNGRVYLPATWVTAEELEHALRASDMGATSRAATQRTLAAVRRVLELAETLYEAAFDGIWSLPWRVRWSIVAAAMCYREIGREVGRRGDRSFRDRVIVSSGRKAWLIALAGLRLFGPRFWWPMRGPSHPAVRETLRAAMRPLEAAQ